MREVTKTWICSRGITPGDAVAAAALLRCFGGEATLAAPEKLAAPDRRLFCPGFNVLPAAGAGEYRFWPLPDYDPDGRLLAGAVLDYCGLEAPDLRAAAAGVTASAPELWQEQSDAVGTGLYFRRNYGRDDFYLAAVKQLAAEQGESSWRAEQREAVKFYRTYGGREILGDSPAIRQLRSEILTVADKDCARILIHGESGTGKESVVWEIHNRSPRRSSAMVVFNCASVNPQLLESRFLGYEKGAFTGAETTRAGVFEQADGGTLFLDEIGELPLEAQGLLLRVLEDGWFRRVGEGEELHPDVRLICASHRDLGAMVAEGKFRQDLFYRLNTVTLEIPPLRDRREDIAAIAAGWRRRRGLPPLTPAQLRELCRYDYPGNVRELLNILSQAEVLGEEDYRQVLHRHRGGHPAETAPEPLPEPLTAAVREHCRRIFARYRGNLTAAAAALEISRNTLRKYLS